ncbi:MAG: hypothetical protein LBD85_06705 [Oscillospiraceae bacterium]|nr:hypothetical protein [Oscillospiraceae bacterium]
MTNDKNGKWSESETLFRKDIAREEAFLRNLSAARFAAVVTSRTITTSPAR